MYVLGFLLLAAILAGSVGATSVGAQVWRVSFRPTLLRTALFLAPLVVAWLPAIWRINEFRHHVRLTQRQAVHIDRHLHPRPGAVHNQKLGRGQADRPSLR